MRPASPCKSSLIRIRSQGPEGNYVVLPRAAFDSILAQLQSNELQSAAAVAALTGAVLDPAEAMARLQGEAADQIQELQRYDHTHVMGVGRQWCA